MSLARSMAWSMGGQGIALVFSMAGTVILARLLTPGETGAFAFAMAILALAQSLLQLGMGNYILRAGALTPSLLNAATTLAILQGVAASVLIATSAPFAGAFSGAHSVGWITLVAAAAPLFSGPEAIGIALWSREGRFGLVGAQGALKAFVQAVTGVATAWAGWGAYSLAAGFVAAGIFACGWSSYHIFIRNGVRLGLTREEWRELRGYSASSMLLSITITVNQRLPEMLIGRLFGIASLGQFARSGGTIDMLRKSVSYPTARVFVPRMMNALNRGQSVDRAVGDIRDAFLFIMWPALAGLAVLAEPVTLLLYGEQWRLAGHILAILCLACALDVAHSGFAELLLFRDKLPLSNRIELGRLAISIGLLLLAWPFGFMAVVWSRVASAVIGCLIYGWVLHRLEAIPLHRYVGNYGVHGYFALAACLPALMWMQAEGWPRRLPFGEILLVSAGGVIFWALALLSVGHPAAKTGLRVLKRWSRLGVR